MLRLSADQLADLLIKRAIWERRLGMWLSVRPYVRRFHFELCQRLTRAAQSLVKGEVYLLKGPTPDLCLSTDCLEFVREGCECPHETGGLVESPAAIQPA
jgi:hypothetical protein